MVIAATAVGGAASNAETKVDASGGTGADTRKEIAEFVTAKTVSGITNMFTDSHSRVLLRSRASQ